MKGRGPVVHLDRTDKAHMIAAVLGDHLRRPVEGFRTLDIGCGNGGISEFLARSNQHYAVDIADKRINKDARYAFQVVDSEQLPFPDGYFDIVVSHHVIEHVADQGLHLDEIHRALTPAGIAYLATPNRSSPIMEGHVGNDRVLRYREMGPLFRRHHFEPSEYGVRVIKEAARFHGEFTLGTWIPVWALKLMRPLFPSHVFVLEKAED